VAIFKPFWPPAQGGVSKKIFGPTKNIAEILNFGAISDLYRLDFCFNKLKIWLESSKPVF